MAATTPKTAIVTGASSGMGYSICEAYLERGYNVVANARTLERLQAAAEKLGNPKNLKLVEGHIGEPETATRIFDTAVKAFKKVDILVNNAGIFIAKPTKDFTTEDIDSIINTNVKGFIYPTKLAAAHMAANGSGHIMSITATIAMQPNIKLPCIMTALIKGGLNHAVKALALELAPSGVQVNAVAPGIIDTPIHTRDEGMWQFLRTLAPNGKTGVTKDIVDAVLYLTDSTFVTGTVMPVDGGSTAGVW